MSIEIKELVIRAVAEYKDSERKSVPICSGQPTAEDREAIVAAAVKEVMRILKAAKER